MSRIKKHIVVVNAIFPPDEGASGKAVSELVSHLQKNAFYTTVVTTDRAYHSGQNTLENDNKVIRVKSKSSRKYKWWRLITAYRESAALLQKLADISADAYIICTDPPLMNWLAPKYLKGRKFIFWTMDLYPEAFVANRIVTKTNAIVQLYEKRLKTHPPSALISLGKKQKEYLDQKYKWQGIKHFILPCGVEAAHDEESSFPEWKKENGKIYFGYCGNLGEAHSSSFLIALIKKSDPQKHHFIFSIFGSKANSVLSQIGNSSNVTVVNWIKKEEMNYIDIQIVSLLMAWTQVCVPSKAVSAICAFTPFIFHGSNKGDTYHHFKDALWHIDDNNCVSHQIEDFYSSLCSKEIAIRKVEAVKSANKISIVYKEGVENIIKYLSK
ncbi:MAG: hypothetical protein V3V00_13195 [Saprospiraceae bacterium]